MITCPFHKKCNIKRCPQFRGWFFTVLFMNDLLRDPDVLEKFVSAIDAHPVLGAKK